MVAEANISVDSVRWSEHSLPTHTPTTPWSFGSSGQCGREKMITSSEQFKLSHNVLLAGIAKHRTPSIDETYPKADEFLDVRDYLKELAALVDAHILEVAKIAAANACHHGIDADLGKDVLINGLDGFLFHDLEQEAIGVRSAYQACHGPSAYDRARNRREAA